MSIWTGLPGPESVAYGMGRQTEAHSRNAQPRPGRSRWEGHPDIPLNVPYGEAIPQPPIPAPLPTFNHNRGAGLDLSRRGPCAIIQSRPWRHPLGPAEVSGHYGAVLHTNADLGILTTGRTINRPIPRLRAQERGARCATPRRRMRQHALYGRFVVSSTLGGAGPEDTLPRSASGVRQMPAQAGHGVCGCSSVGRTSAFQEILPKTFLLRQYPLWYILLFHPGRNTSHHVASASDATQHFVDLGENTDYNSL
jgi:hypothetical protein